MEVEIIKAPI